MQHNSDKLDCCYWTVEGIGGGQELEPSMMTEGKQE